MLHDRGYLVLPEELDETLEEFRAVFSNTERGALTTKTTKEDGSGV